MAFEHSRMTLPDGVNYHFFMSYRDAGLMFLVEHACYLFARYRTGLYRFVQVLKSEYRYFAKRPSRWLKSGKHINLFSSRGDRNEVQN